MYRDVGGLRPVGDAAHLLMACGLLTMLGIGERTADKGYPDVAPMELPKYRPDGLPFETHRASPPTPLQRRGALHFGSKLIFGKRNARSAG